MYLVTLVGDRNMKWFIRRSRTTAFLLMTSLSLVLHSIWIVRSTSNTRFSVVKTRISRSQSCLFEIPKEKGPEYLLRVPAGLIFRVLTRSPRTVLVRYYNFMSFLTIPRDGCDFVLCLFFGMTNDGEFLRKMNLWTSFERFLGRNQTVHYVNILHSFHTEMILTLAYIISQPVWVCRRSPQILRAFCPRLRNVIRTQHARYMNNSHDSWCCV